MAASLPVSASLIDGGLEWLPVTDSTDLSFAEVQTEFQSGGAFEGFRHATLTEVSNLATTFGFDSGLSEEANSAAVQALQAALDTTFVSAGGTLQFSTLGYLDDGSRYDIVLQLPDPDVVETFRGSIFTFATGGFDPASPLVGHYLVRVVPEPSTAALVAGLVVASLLLKRRRA